MSVSPLIVPNNFVRDIYVGGDIDDETSSDFIRLIYTLEEMVPEEPIMVYINNAGGRVMEALAMYDAMTTVQCPVYTVGIGKIMSAAVVLLAAGEQGHRYLTPNATVMIHEVSARPGGTLSQLRESVQEIGRLQDIYLTLLSRHSGIPKDKLAKDISPNKDLYFNSEQAISRGIADYIIATRKNVFAKKKKK